MKTKHLNTILNILGLLILTAFIWFRFVRERIPKDIPFNLSIEGLLILIEICLIYSYILFTLTTEKKLSNAFISALINNIFKPLIALDQSIKNHPSINPYYKRFIVYLANKLDPILNKSKVYYYTFAILPRLVLVTALCIDVFYFHKLFYIYRVLLIGILLILNRYIIYSLNYATEHFTTQLEPLIYKPHIRYNLHICAKVYYNGDEEAAHDDYEGDETLSLELNDVIFYAANSIYYHNEKLSYTILNKNEYKEIYCKKYHIPFPYNANDIVSNSVWLQIREEINQKIENIIKISVLLLYYQLYNNFTPEIKRMKVLIFSNYLLCWLFILIVSIPTLRFEFSLIPIILDTIEPFSGVPLDLYTDIR